MEVIGELEKNNFDKVVGQKPDWSRLERIEGKELDVISIDNSLEEFATKGRKEIRPYGDQDERSMIKRFVCLRWDE